MNLLLMMGWLCFGDAPFWQNGGHLIVSENAHSLLCYNLNQKSQDPQRLEGNLLSLTASHVILQRSDQYLLITLGTGASQVLPDPPARPITGELSDLALPALLSQDQLMLWIGESWQTLPIPIWYEYTAARPIPGSHLGFTPLWPNLFSGKDGLVYAYQAKSGALVSFDPKTKRTRTQTLDKKLVPLPLRDDLLWIGAPKEGRIGLAASGTPSQIIDQKSVDDLSEHSLAVPTHRGLWLLTFASGIRDGLKSWDRGTVRVAAHYVRAEATRLTVRSYAFGDLPVDFALTTSSSGSPKLAVAPAFAASAVHGSELLVIARADTLSWIDPNGKRGSLVNGAKSLPLALSTAKGGLEIYTVKGHQFQAWSDAP